MDVANPMEKGAYITTKENQETSFDSPENSILWSRISSFCSVPSKVQLGTYFWVKALIFLFPQFLFLSLN
eukprot:scaffold408_cov71-Cylindrotheca_fusiformis.AAC.7